jgi:hypothetical protein
MMMRSDDEVKLKRFLLGELSEPETERVERRLLEDDELFELTEAFEWEMLEDCALGRLPPEERERVLARLASTPQGKRRLALAGGLAEISRERARGDDETPTAEIVPFPWRRPTPAARARPWIALAAALLLALLGAWLGIRQLGDGTGSAAPATEARRTPSTPPAQAPPAEGERIAGPTARPLDELPEAPPPTAPEAPRDDSAARPAPPRRPEPAVLQLALAVLRGAGGPPRLEVPPGTERVEIQLDVTGYGDYESFDATLRDAARLEVAWRAEGIRPRRLDGGPTLVLEVPAQDLPSGRYELEVGGRPVEGAREELSFQELEVVRRP